MNGQNLAFLTGKGLARNGHPTIKAYKIALETVDDTSLTVADMMKHVQGCPQCFQKLQYLLKQ